MNDETTGKKTPTESSTWRDRGFKTEHGKRIMAELKKGKFRIKPVRFINSDMPDRIQQYAD